MDEQAPRTRDVIAETLIREGIGLLVFAGIMWLTLGGGRKSIEYLRARFGARPHRRRARIDAECAQFAREISRAEHDMRAADEPFA